MFISSSDGVSGNMIECSKCKEWYHINPRVQIPKEALKRGVQWICQYCLSIIVIKMSYFRVGSKYYKDPPRSKYFMGGPNTSTIMCNIWTPGSIYYYIIWTGGSILGGSIFFVTSPHASTDMHMCVHVHVYISLWESGILIRS